jgi:hypothetical protein
MNVNYIKYKISEWWYVNGFLVIGAAVSCSALAGLAGFAYFVTVKDCAAYNIVTGRNTKFVAGSCYVQEGSDWYTRDEYKARMVAAEARK